jgi:hypothetical protein
VCVVPAIVIKENLTNSGNVSNIHQWLAQQLLLKYNFHFCMVKIVKKNDENRVSLNCFQSDLALCTLHFTFTLHNLAVLNQYK